jgi:hypothetical protein
VNTPPPTRTQGSERPQHDSRDFKSGGSIGGTSSGSSSARNSTPSSRPSNSGSSSGSSSGNRPALRGKDAKRK